MTPVESSNISTVGLEGSTMIVKFKSGTTYSYEDVPEETYEEVLHAESVGGAFHKLIRGKFTYRKH